MLIEEAQWLGKQLVETDMNVGFPLLNIGSSTKNFRVNGQPWIDKFIFRPLRERNLSTFHTDIKKAEGVDIVGDVTSAEFTRELQKIGIRSIICSNLLEHVLQKEIITQAIVNILPVDGLIFATCPRDYPYHADPIDNGFRPDVIELSQLFPKTLILKGEIIQSGTYGNYLSQNKFFAVKMFLRLLFPIYKPKAWITQLNHWLWLNRKFSATCVVLRRIS